MSGHDWRRSGQAGDIVIEDGVKPDTATLEVMDYLVEGVVGTIPQ